jgi:hypothetical protein
MASSFQEAQSSSSTRDRDALIGTLYREGEAISHIARLAGVCEKTVRNVARRQGIPRRRITQPDRDAAIVARYRAGDRVAQIAAEFSVNPSWVRHVAARAEVPARTGWRRLYPIDEGVFDHPTAVGWWLIGLLAADGSVASRQAAVWLGMLDGDGSIGVYREGRLVRLMFCGTRQVMEQCQDFWRNALELAGERPAVRPHSGEIWTFRLHNAKARHAAEILLSSSPVSMRRKRALLMDIAR